MKPPRKIEEREGGRESGEGIDRKRKDEIAERERVDRKKND